METKLIPDTFKGKVVLITGATGFVGKVLLEKLLRSCPGISEVIILVRPTEKGCEIRFSTFLKSVVFDLINVKCPDVLDKIRCMPGDVESENMGLDTSDLKKVISEVSFVFHCAANVRFGDEPRKTFNVNLLGVKNVLDVCHSMKKLEALVHVSTAYSFCNQVHISEDICAENVGPNRILSCLRWMNYDHLQAMSSYLVQGRPSLYHYSKAMAEIYLEENHGNLPVVIVRPAIITAAVKEPFPGWIDNHNGPSGFIALSSKGIIRTLLVKKDIYADWIPVDTVVNTLIAAAHSIVVERQTGTSLLVAIKPSGIPVINCVGPQYNVLTWSKIIKICSPLVYKYPSFGFYRLPGRGFVTSSRTLHTFCKYFYHYLPAVILDVVVFPYYRQMRFLRCYRRIHGVMNHLQHYTTHSFIFSSANMQRLMDQMNYEDTEVFPIDLNSMDWNEYLEDYVHGVRRYYLKESDCTLSRARRKAQVVQHLYYLWQITAAGIFSMCLYKRVPIVKSGVHWTFMLISKALKMIGKL